MQFKALRNLDLSHLVMRMQGDAELIINELHHFKSLNSIAMPKFQILDDSILQKLACETLVALFNHQSLITAEISFLIESLIH